MKTELYKCGPFTYKFPECACVFCELCTDLYWDYSNGIYMLFCDCHDSPDGNLKGTCKDFKKES